MEARLHPVPDPAPYEDAGSDQQMARFLEPAPHQTALLLYGLHDPARLSRQLPSAIHFRLIRSLWTDIDEIVTDERGISARHSAEGGSAFFLVEDLGSPSAAAAAAISAARGIQEVARSTRKGSGVDCEMSIALHWGTHVYVGQLAAGPPNVAALGDDVNEAARLHEIAGANEMIASKQILEQLSDDDAARLGLDIDRMTYTFVPDLPAAPKRSIRENLRVPVAHL